VAPRDLAADVERARLPPAGDDFDPATGIAPARYATEWVPGMDRGSPASTGGGPGEVARTMRLLDKQLEPGRRMVELPPRLARAREAFAVVRADAHKVRVIALAE
jgi:hypothetical protein